jgi:hypothetical protein
MYSRALYEHLRTGRTQPSRQLQHEHPRPNRKRFRLGTARERLVRIGRARSKRLVDPDAESQPT